jgi:hypothetical protein
MTETTPSGTDKDAIKNVLQDTLLQQVQALMKFTSTESLQLQVPEQDLFIFAGPRARIADFIGREIATPASDYSFTVKLPSEPGTYVVGVGGVVEKLFDVGPLDLTKPLPPVAQKIADDVKDVIADLQAQREDNTAESGAVEQPAGDLPRKMMETVMSNLLDRCGVFDDIDDDIMDEIREEMRAAIAAHLAQHPKAEQPSIKTWQERMPSNWRDGGADLAEEAAMKAEIADLRAALAGQSQATKAQVVPEKLHNFISNLANLQPEAYTTDGLRTVTRAFCNTAADLLSALCADPVSQEVEQGSVQAQSSPPFAAPAGQHRANPLVIAELRRWAGDDPGYAAMLVRRAITEIEELEAVLASRCRAQGGENKPESSDLAPTTSTVSAPDEIRNAARAVVNDALEEMRGRVHPCDQNNDEVVARHLPPLMQYLDRVLRTVSASGSADTGSAA